MKKIKITVFIILISLTSFAQDVTGSWYGMLKVPGTQLPVVINVTKFETGYKATMDSPEQKAFGIPVPIFTFADSKFKFEIPEGRIDYSGILSENNVIKGFFRQRGQSFPLDFSREKIEIKKAVRPQEPIKPYPYYSEDVTFENKKEGITLAGTLTLPQKEGNFPVVVLISGSSPQNRDEEILEHKPFLVISDYLTRNGIAVLRYDDRGTALSKGKYSGSTTLDFATDTQAAVDYLLTRKEINKNKIGLVGHSEGGVIAPMVAANSKSISFIVLLAGVGIKGGDLLLLQQELVGRASGVSERDLQKTKIENKGAYNIIYKSNDIEKLTTDLTDYFNKKTTENPDMKIPEGMSKDAFIKTKVDTYTNPWWNYFIKLDPAVALKKVKCPVLALNGSKDLQVPAKENLTAIKNVLTKAGNSKVTTIELPNLNHLFQESKTGSPDEYEQIEQTFSPTALEEMLKWINIQVK